MTTQNDFMPFDANEYRAVVNPTSMMMQTWGYGRRLVLVPGELKNPRRSPIQFVKTRIARKAVKNQRRFLELMTVEQGMRLLNLARELDDFPAAYKRLTGKTGTKAAEILMEAQEKGALRRVLIAELGVPDNVIANWTVSDMRAVIKDQTLVADLDERGRPRLDATSSPGSLFDAVERAAQPTDAQTFREFAQEEPRLPSSEDRVDEGGVPGDFFIPETISADEESVEEIAARSTSEFDAQTGGEVTGEAPPTLVQYQGIQTIEEAPVEEKDLEAPPPEPDLSSAPQMTDQQTILTLRNQIENLGGKWHGRSGIARLQDQLSGLISASVNTEAAG